MHDIASKAILVILLSAIEGFTEFLPISSTGHLIIASDYFSSIVSDKKFLETDFINILNIIIQGSAILGVLLLYKKKFINESQKIFSNRNNSNLSILDRFRFPIQLALTFIPLGVIGFILDSTIKIETMLNKDLTLMCFIVGGILLIFCDRMDFLKSRNPIQQIESITFGQCFAIGLFQAVALFPGMSRSAMVICGCLLLGMKKRTAIEFSFMAGIPALVVTSVYYTITNISLITSEMLIYLLLGCVASFLCTIASIKFLIYITQKAGLTTFGVYRILFAIIILLIG